MINNISLPTNVNFTGSKPISPNTQGAIITNQLRADTISFTSQKASNVSFGGIVDDWINNPRAKNLLINEAVSDFNAFRLKHNNYKPDFPLIDLNSKQLEYIDLHNTNLKNANLVDTKLMHANLKEANLEHANLFGVILKYTNLEHANLEHANLTGANLYKVSFENTNLEHANLKNTYLEDANLKNAFLIYANLIYANLEHANLTRANLAGANLEGVNLKGANLKGANLTNTNFKNAYYDNQTSFPIGFDPIAHSMINKSTSNQTNQTNSSSNTYNQTGGAKSKTGSVKQTYNPKETILKENINNLPKEKQEIAKRILSATTPYEVLGIKENATKDELKKAYRTLSKKFHPDKNKEINGEFFVRINSANQKIKDLNGW